MSDYDAKEEEFVYPGHPVQIAYQISITYASLEEAVQVGRQYPSALENGVIRGAGGTVSTALHLLQQVRRGQLSFDEYAAAADDSWGRVDGNATEPKLRDRYQKGLAVAARILPVLRASGWVRGPDPVVESRFERSLAIP